MELPRNHDAEREVLGSIYHDPSSFYDARERVSTEDFHHPRFRVIFDGMATLASRSEPIEFPALIQVLRDAGKLDDAGGYSFVSETLDAGFTATTLETNARIVRDLARRRRLIATCQTIAQRAGEPIEDARAFFDEVERDVLRVTGERVDEHTADMASAIEEAEELTAEAALNPDGLVGVPTGLSSLDRTTRGLKRQNLVIAAGRPGSGKSALAGGIAVHAACRAGVPTVIFSLEMSRAEIAQRMRSFLSGVSGTRLASGLLSPSDRTALDQANTILRATPMRINDRGDLTPFEIAAAARRYQREMGGLGLVVVDYLQLVKVKSRASSTREQDVAEVSRSLKALAKELHAPVLALAQLNRNADGRPDGKPRLSDLRESGSLEQDADVVLLIHREELTNATPANRGLAEIIVAKQRNGETGRLKFRYDGALCQFSEAVSHASGGVE